MSVFLVCASVGGACVGVWCIQQMLLHQLRRISSRKQKSRIPSASTSASSSTSATVPDDLISDLFKSSSITLSTSTSTSASSLLPAELERFSSFARDWWNPLGPSGQLMKMNPVRVEWIRDDFLSRYNAHQKLINPDFVALSQAATDLRGLRILDVGCGGGILTEALARLGAEVIGIDASLDLINVAIVHRDDPAQHRDDPQWPGCANRIKYINCRAEELLSHLTNSNREFVGFDLVCALEIVEHVADPQAFVQTISQLLRRTTNKSQTDFSSCISALYMSTIAKTPLSYALAIIAAEYLLRFTPIHTHAWSQFISFDSLVSLLPPKFLYTNLDGKYSLRSAGMFYNPFTDSWTADEEDGKKCNYILAAQAR